MGNQGSINPYVNDLKSPLDAIAAGVSALRNYYGIDTDKAEAALKGAIQRKTEAETGLISAKQSAMKDLVSQISKVGQGSGQPTQQIGPQPVMSPDDQRAARLEIYGTALKQHPEIADEINKDIEGEMNISKAQAQPGQLAAEANKPNVEASGAFTKLAEGELASLKQIDQGRALLATGGAITGKMAMNAALMASDSIKRVGSETGQDVGEATGLLGKSMEAIQKAIEGNQPGQVRKEFAKMLDIYENANIDSMRRKANFVGSQYAAGAQQKPQDISNGLMAAFNGRPSAESLIKNLPEETPPTTNENGGLATHFLSLFTGSGDKSANASQKKSTDPHLDRINSILDKRLKK